MIKLMLSIYVLILLFAVTHPVHAANEVVQVYDRKGKLFATVEGDERHTVVMPDARWRDGVLVHTHPAPGLPDLSFADMRVAYAANLRQMCAVSDEATCCATRTGRYWRPISRKNAAAADRRIVEAIQGQTRADARRIHHAIIAAYAAATGASYACS